MKDPGLKTQKPSWAPGYVDDEPPGTDALWPTLFLCLLSLGLAGWIKARASTPWLLYVQYLRRGFAFRGEAGLFLPRGLAPFSFSLSPSAAPSPSSSPSQAPGVRSVVHEDDAYPRRVKQTAIRPRRFDRPSLGSARAKSRKTNGGEVYGMLSPSLSLSLCLSPTSLS